MNNNSSYTIAAKPIKMLELHYPMTQFLIITGIPRVGVGYEMIVAHEARSAELAIIISYPTSASE